MLLRELFEAIGTIGSTTDTVPQDGLPKTGNVPSAQKSQDKPTLTPPIQNNQIQNTLTGMKDLFTTAGGKTPDANRIARTLSQTDPNKPADPAALKSLQPLIPAIADTLKDPQSAAQLKQAIKTGVNLDQAARAKLAVAQKQQTLSRIKTI